MESINGFPKRVVLLFKSSKSDEEVVKAFLRHYGRAEGEYESNERYIHLDPDRKNDEGWSHIVLDMDLRKVGEVGLYALHHDIYKVNDTAGGEDL